MEYRALQKRAAAPPRPKKHWPGPVDLKAEIDPAADEGIVGAKRSADLSPIKRERAGRSGPRAISSIR